MTPVDERDGLQGFVKKLEESLRFVTGLTDLSDEKRIDMGLSVDIRVRLEENTRRKVLETVLADARTVLEQLSVASGVCTSWLEINKGRFVCGLLVGHEGPHQSQVTERVDKQRLDAKVSWTMEAYLQKVP